MHIRISVLGVVFAIVSVVVARMATTFIAPHIEGLFGLTPKQEEWIFLLMVWAIGYWGHALKVIADTEFKKRLALRRKENSDQPPVSE